MPAPRRALIVIDAQREYFEGALPIRYPDPEVSVRRIRAAVEAGRVPARQVHETLMALLHSNWAAVATTDAWVAAGRNGASLSGSNLVASAQGSIR